MALDKLTSKDQSTSKQMALSKPTSNQFDTTVVQANSPGLTYAQPQADQSGKYYNSLGAFAEIANAGVTNATRVDQAFVEAEARRTAEDMSHELDSFDEAYKLQFDINNTQNKLRQAQTDEEKLSLQAELEGYAERLSKLDTQNMPNPYEFKMRMNAKAADIYHRNPAYASEISAQMNKIFNIHGVSDKLNILQSGMDAANKLAEKEYEMKIKYLNEKRHIDTSQLDREEVDESYALEKGKERSYLILEEYSKDNAIISEYEKTKFEEQVKAEGGIHAVSSNIMENVFNQLLELESMPGDFNTKETARKQIITSAMAIVNKTAGSLPSKNTTEYTTWHTNMMAYLKYLDDESKDALVQGRSTTALKNQKEQMLYYNQITRIVEGKDPESIDVNVKMSQIFANLYSSGNFNNSIALKQMQEMIADVVINGGRQTNLKNPFIQDYLKLEASNSTAAWSQTALSQLKNKGELNLVTVKTLNNMWLESQQFTDTLSLQRYEAGGKVITNMLKLDDKVWNYMMDKEPDFRNSANFELNVNGGISTNILLNPRNGLLIEETKAQEFKGITVNPYTGRLSYDTNVSIDNVLNRVNQYIALKARIDGTTFKQASDDVLAEGGAFHYLTKDGFKKIRTMIQTGEIDTLDILNRPITP